MNVPIPRPLRVPPLQNGDRLTRDEFELRYQPPSVAEKADLIDGIVQLRVPVRPFRQPSARVDLCAWAGLYRASTPGVDAGAHATVRLSAETAVHPDVYLIVRPEYGGRIRLDAAGVLEGPGELFADLVADESIDSQSVFLRAGVRELVRWNFTRRTIEWLTARDGRFVPIRPDPADGLLKSEHLPGLWLHPSALLEADRKELFAALQRGLATPEHAAFVQTLAAARR